MRRKLRRKSERNPIRGANSSGAKWSDGYKHAQEFYDLNGNLLVPCSYVCPDGYNLGQWIRSQRSARKGNSYAQITPERVEMLDKIGMVWGVKRVRDS